MMGWGSGIRVRCGRSERGSCRTGRRRTHEDVDDADADADVQDGGIR